MTITDTALRFPLIAAAFALVFAAAAPAKAEGAQPASVPAAGDKAQPAPEDDTDPADYHDWEHQQEIPLAEPEAIAASDDEDAEDPASWPEPRRACIQVSRLRDFSVIDRRHAIFYESPRRPFLVTFSTSCTELYFATRILTASRTGRLCGGAGERIIVNRRRCFVRSIERVASKAQAEFLVEKRTAEAEERREQRRQEREERRRAREDGETVSD